MSKKQITIPVFIPHSGCPHCCVFCNQWKVTGLSEKISSDEVHKTVKMYLSELPAGIEKIEIAFFGGSFTAIPDAEQVEYLSAVNTYIKKGIIDSVRISTRPDYIDKSKLDLLKEYNVETVELGVQSFSDEVLNASGRGHNSEQVVDAVLLLKKNKFRVGIQLMPGLPGDNYELTIQSAEKTVDLVPDDVRIYPAVVLKDTALEKLFNEKKFVPLTIEEAVDRCSVMYGMFSENGINVIRMGLHPMDFAGEKVISGPYHDALGFMIKSRYRRTILEKIFQNSLGAGTCNGRISLVIPEIMKEEFIGMKKENILYLKDKFQIQSLVYSFGNIEFPQILP